MTEPICEPIVLLGLNQPDHWFDCDDDVCVPINASVDHTPSSIQTAEDGHTILFAPPAPSGSTLFARIEAPEFNPLAATVHLRILVDQPESASDWLISVQIRGTVDSVNLPLFLWGTPTLLTQAAQDIECVLTRVNLSPATNWTIWAEVATSGGMRIDYLGGTLCDTATGNQPTGVHAPILLQFLGV